MKSLFNHTFFARLVFVMALSLCAFAPQITHAQEPEVIPLIGDDSAEPTAEADGAQAEPKEDENAITAETYRQLNLFGDIFERVREQYVEKVEDKDLVEAAINGMLTSLDPHSSFLNADEFEDMRVQTKGEFGGLGIEVTMENGLVKVVSPIDDTPAFTAGMQAGDLLIRLDGEEVMGLTLSQAVDKMRGPVGKKIVLTVVREGVPDPFDVEIIRDTIKIRSVRSELVGDDVGYIRITSFNEQVSAKLPDAIKDLKKEAGKKLKGFILDLRNNPGGLLNEAVFVSDAFLEQGEIVSTRGRLEDDIQREMAKPGDLANGLPVVVLVNGGSASASEIVAGALQDHRRAVIMGTKTFGKGSVQTIVGLGNEGAMRLTTARYYTPSGRSIQATGIEPDIQVGLAKVEEIVSTYQAPKEADLHGALTNDKTKTDKVNPAEETGDEPADMEDRMAKDYQLSRAADLIRGVSFFSQNPLVNLNDTVDAAPVADNAEENKKKDKK